MSRTAKLLAACLILVGLVSAGLLAYATPHGVGLYYDSLEYLTSAENLAAGRGLGRLTCTHFKPLVLFPPAYPIALTIGSLFGSAPIQFAWLINPILLASDAILIGVLAYLATRSWVLAVLVSMSFGTAAVTIRVFSWAMTEPLYLCLVLGSLVLAAVYLDTRSFKYLLGSSVLIGLAMATRYVGVGLLIAFVIAIGADIDLPLRQRAKAVLAAVVVACLPLSIWLVRNSLLVAEATNRSLGLYLPDTARFRELASTVLLWFVPVVPGIRTRWLLILALAAFVGLLLLWRWYARLPSGKPPAYRLARLLLLAALAHLSVVLLYSVFLRPPIPFDNRILFPLYVLILLLLPALLAPSLRPSAPLPALVLSVAITAVVLQQLRALPGTLADLRREGQGYANNRWQGSETALALKADPPPIIYTNDITAVYFAAGLPACAVPADGDFVALARMRESLAAAPGAVAIFGQLTGEFMSLEDITRGLREAEHFRDGTIYEPE